MFGCIRRLGCLLLLAALAVAAFLLRDRWWPSRDSTTASKAAAETPIWELLTPEGAERGRRAVASLEGPAGPVFVNLSGGDLASYVFTGIAKQLPPSARDVRAAVIGERLYVKALIAMSDVGGPAVLGPLASFLADRDTVTLGGSFEMVRPGLAQYRVQEIRLRELGVPRKLLPRLVGQLRRGSLPEGVSGDALPLVVPGYIGDVRIARGRVTLYKTVQ